MKIEQEAATAAMNDKNLRSSDVLAISQAISLKRIADALERLLLNQTHPLLRPDGNPNSILDIARQGE